MTTSDQTIPDDANNFYRSDSVEMKGARFTNQYKMAVAGNLCVPKNAKPGTTYPAIIIGHPMGAVKEQSATLYANKLAEQGFITLAVDMAYWGQSGGEPRNAVSGDMYAETFSAGVDYLSSLELVDSDRIGGVGICGSGGFLIAAAKIDSRIKAVATVSMYDMGAATRSGIGNSISLEDRKESVKQASAQRTAEFNGEELQYTGGCPHEIDSDTPAAGKEFYNFYRTERGQYTPTGVSEATTTHPTLSSNVKFLNFYPFNDIDTISPRPMLFIAGEEAHSLEFTEDAYELAAEPKEKMLIPDAGHVDLYDRTNKIPFDRLMSFFGDSLK